MGREVQSFNETFTEICNTGEGSILSQVRCIIANLIEI